MKHLMNNLSHKYLCQVKTPRVTPNTTDVGSMLAGIEPVCRVCFKFWTDYRKLSPLKMMGNLNRKTGL